MRSFSSASDWVPMLGAFAIGGLLTQAPQLVGLEQVVPTDWLVLIPFLISVGLFLVFAVLMVLHARTGLGEEAAAGRERLHAHLGEAHNLLRERLAQAHEDLQHRLQASGDELQAVLERSGQDAEHRLNAYLQAIATCVESSTQKRCEVIFEPDFEDRTTSRCYDALVPLIRATRKSILVIPNAYTCGKLDTWELPPRASYLEAIEERVVQAKGGSGFEYLRFQQVHDIDRDLCHQIGQAAVEHMHRIQALGVGDIAKLRLIQQEHISGQLIIDGETLVKFISGVDNHGDKRLVAVTIMRDPTSRSLQTYSEKLRSSLLDNGRKLTADELSRAVPNA